MKINLLTEKTSLFRLTDYDALDTNMLHNGYSVKTEAEILSWRLTDDTIDSVEFIFTSPDTSLLSEIDLYVAGGENNANHIIKIYTSIDYSNWYELPYKADNDYVYKKVGDNLYNLTTYETIPYDELLDYVYTKVNDFSGEEENLYTDHEFRYLKLVITGLTASVANPVYFDRFYVYVNEELSNNVINQNILEIKSDNLYKPKFYEDYEFLPSMITNYMTMLEFNGTFSEIVNQLTNHHYINTFDERQYIGYDDDGINFDYIDFDLKVYPDP